MRILGEKETAVASVGFEFLGLYRPGVILGNSNTPGYLGSVMPLLQWAIPAKYRSIHKNDLARAMVTQSEQAFLALPPRDRPLPPVVQTLEYREMQRFIVPGDRNEP